MTEEYEDGTRVSFVWPPPVMARWMKGQSVPTGDLAAELRFWAGHMSGEVDREQRLEGEQYETD